MDITSTFHAYWTFKPLLLIGLLGLALAYGVFWRRLRLSGSEHALSYQPWLFVTGLIGMGLLTASPLDDLGMRALFLARMFEYILIVYVLPCLLWMGTPAPLSALIWERLHYRELSAWLGSIVAPSLLFNLVFLIWHVPLIFETALHHAWFNQIQLLGLLGAGYMMWMPLLNPFGPMRLPLPRQMFYVVTLVFAQVPVFALLTFSRQVLYESYLNVPRITPLSAYADQQLGGWMLKTVTSVIFAAAFIRIFLEWNNHARRQDAEDNVMAFENIELVRRAAERKG